MKAKHEGWVNIYRPCYANYCTSLKIYPTKKEAKEAASVDALATTKVEWEEEEQ